MRRPEVEQKQIEERESEDAREFEKGLLKMLLLD